jgi:hypothetical protein
MQNSGLRLLDTVCTAPLGPIFVLRHRIFLIGFKVTKQQQRKLLRIAWNSKKIDQKITEHRVWIKYKQFKHDPETKVRNVHVFLKFLFTCCPYEIHYSNRIQKVEIINSILYVPRYRLRNSTSYLKQLCYYFQNCPVPWPWPGLHQGKVLFYFG